LITAESSFITSTACATVVVAQSAFGSSMASSSITTPTVCASVVIECTSASTRIAPVSATERT
jgi:hypothetical protein